MKHEQKLKQALQELDAFYPVRQKSTYNNKKKK